MSNNNIDIKFNQLPAATSIADTDIFALSQTPNTFPVSRKVTSELVSQYILAKTILTTVGNPNGFLAGTIYQLCWDSLDGLLFVCTTTGTSSTAVWQRSPTVFSFAGDPNGNVAGQLNDIVFNSAAGDLYVCTTAGSAISAVWTQSSGTASNVIITNDTTTNASVFPTWVLANSGNQSLKVTSTKIFYNPSTSVFTNIGPLSQITNIQDSTGLKVLDFSYLSSSVNNIKISNAITGTSPVISTEGTNANVGLIFSVKNANISFNDSTNTIAPKFIFFNAAHSHSTSLSAQTSQATDLSLVLPAVDGVNKGIMQTDGSGNLSLSTVSYPSAPGWTNFTPTLTLVGGTGNVVPTFTTNLARFSQVGNVVFMEVNLSNASGNTAGAGSGQLNINLPVTASATQTQAVMFSSFLLNGATGYMAGLLVLPNATTAVLEFLSGTSAQGVQGATLNDANIRQIQIKFFYEI